MVRIFLLFLIVSSLVACSQSPSGVRITKAAIQSVPVVVQSPAKSEPVFYNGKIYQVAFVSDPAGGYAMTVTGMAVSQQKDAVAVATSSLRQFACGAKQSGKLLSQPQYDGGQWHMTAHCI